LIEVVAIQSFRSSSKMPFTELVRVSSGDRRKFSSCSERLSSQIVPEIHLVYLDQIADVKVSVGAN
jgi:hypothetical protein